MAEEVPTQDDVDWDLLGCCRRDLMVGWVPLLPLLCEQRESLLSDFTNLDHSDKQIWARAIEIKSIKVITFQF